MSKQIKRKYRKERQQFRKDLKIQCDQNAALAMLIIRTYRAEHHFRHITKIWSMFRDPSFHNFHQAYNERLFGKVLTGQDDIWHSLYFAEKELYDRYNSKIPSCYAMGDALGVAYKSLKKKS